MIHSARGARRVPIDHLSARAALPQAPLAMPKQIIEVQTGWLLALFTRLVRRAQ